ncbi:MAG TPA: RNB domain-containing ribonuclease, partial [Terrimesophilobacter sp.]|nr:RNB domain-containing ribonuclease [Terrimesophilobacter sp.]
VLEKDGQYSLELREPLPCEAWNAQISLLTGMAAAQLMLEGGVGILRTMPPADEESIARFRRQAAGLGTPWPKDVEYGEYLRRLDPANPRHRAITQAAASLFRGAGYTAFDGEAPQNSMQAAIAAPYAHATAPLRRLVDRFVLLVCEALANGREVDAAVREALPTLPGLMASSDGRVSQFEAAAVNTIEAAVLAHRVGEVFEVTVIALRNGGGTVQLVEPAVTAVCDGDLKNGTTVRARLVEADVAMGLVRFEVVP